uniref:Uncharacterized protein n=1 Tax=Aegilops tauschii TaxID=37682 RepID=N1QV24_AEGTA
MARFQRKRSLRRSARALIAEDSLLYDTYPSARHSGQWPEDILLGSNLIWVMDETSIPLSHLEMERLVITQDGLSKMYNQYLLPNRKRAWAEGNDEKFMQDNSLFVAKLSTLKLYFSCSRTLRRPCERIFYRRLRRLRDNGSRRWLCRIVITATIPVAVAASR